MPYLLIVFVFLLSACSNQFAYKSNDWELMIQTDRSDYQEVYIDRNRIDCKDGKCTAWVKFIFAQDRDIPYSGSKEGQTSGTMKVKRMDSSVQYDCTANLATIISYQLYDGKSQMIDSKWIKFEPEYAKPNTIHGAILKRVCKKEIDEDAKQN